MATYHIPAERRYIHGSFDRERAPVITIEPGDTVVFQTLDAGWGEAGQELFDVPLPAMEIEDEERRNHALSGPVWVRGAEPGTVLEIRIDAIDVGHWGTTFAGNQPRLGAERAVRLGWRIDRATATAVDSNGLGLTVPIRPFMGVMGNAPAEPGRHTTIPPRRVGGNLDCRELVTGSTLWLPVDVPGALFSVGDGHALQGDGEVSFTAIECPMDRVELTFEVRTDMAIDAPQAMTPAGFLTLGIGTDLDEASEKAIQAMLDHMEQRYGLGRSEALALASLVVELRVTQIANETLGVHALLPHHAFQKQ